MATIDELRPGQELSNDELRQTFRCGNMGGMLRSATTKTLIIVSDPFKGLYEDRWVDGVLHYTGMGQRGDQSLRFAQNKTLAESPANGVRVHLLEVHEPTKYTYVGEVQLAGEPYQARQPDADGLDRRVWVFPVAPKSAEAAFIPLAALEREARVKDRLAKRLSDAELEARARKSGAQKVGMRAVVSPQYQRNAWVAEHAKRRAAGCCELCKHPAPFNSSAGEPYLEVHHIAWLANGGADTIENTVALCPNCHRRMHILGSADDIEILRVAISSSSIVIPGKVVAEDRSGQIPH